MRTLILLLIACNMYGQSGKIVRDGKTIALYQIREEYPDRDTIPVTMLVTSKGEMYYLDYARQINGYEVRVKEQVGDLYFGGYYYLNHLKYLFDNYSELTGNYTVWISQRIKK